jgi:hypothetical protein
MQPSQLTNYQSGLITPSAVSESQMPMEAVSESINLNFDRIGSVSLREGTTILGNNLSGSLLGLYEFRDSGAGTNNQIIAVKGTAVYYLSSGTWTSKRTVTTGLKSRFATFLDFIFMVNGTDATAIWDGNPSNSFLTTGNASGAPIGKFIENYRSRMWIAGNATYPDRIYYSSIPSAESTPVITWSTDVATGDWIDISPQDGENITALKRDKNALLVFKQNHIYRVYSTSQTDPDPKISVGTYSQESVVDAKDGVYFFHPTGIYRYQEGGVLDISQPIIDFIKNIPASQYENVCGWQDGNHIYWSLGDITENGITHTNVVIRYTISSQCWTTYSYPTKFVVSSPYNDGTTLYYLVGDSSGNVLKTNTGNTDNGTPITYSLITRPYTIDGLFSSTKLITKLSAIHTGAEGSLLSSRVDGDNANKWSPISQVGKSCEPLRCNIRGHKIWFRLSGSSVGEPFVYQGLEILESDSQLVN